MRNEKKRDGKEGLFFSKGKNVFSSGLWGYRRKI